MRKLLCLLPVIFFCNSSLLAQFDSPIQADTLVSSAAQRRGEFSSSPTAAPVPVRTFPPSEVRSLQESDDYWYANREPEKKKMKPAKTWQFDGSGSQTFLWILIVCCFVAVVIWYLASSNIFLFRKKSKPLASDVPDGIHEDIFSLNYSAEIGAAERRGDFRQALRLYYLRTLRDLSEQGLIDFRADRTNTEYLRSLQGGPHYSSFARLTRHFEYSWYGGFSPDQHVYEQLRADFQTFSTRLAA